MENKTITVKDLDLTYKFINSFKLKSNKKKSLKVKKHKALEGVSFDIYKGEIIGICGTNGSGKSTLLRCLAGIFSPDCGQINLYGNSISLLSIGVGFQKKLTGYENIFISGFLLGFSKIQIEEKLNDIIEFSTLKEAIYDPVSTYSSGMYSKLAFSITAILETDIMLIDEVLSVGDAKFKEKSFNKMKELIENKDRTVVIVSHSHKTLRDLCDKVLWLEKGKIRDFDKSDKIIDMYETYLDKEL